MRYFLILFAIVAALMPASIVVNIDNPLLTYVCSLTLISVLICRIIARMHDLAMNEATRMLPSDEEDFPLTTFICSHFTEKN
ncbi:hypothetical protein BJ165DRAFT_1501959 [Panaeolus papilionaceus]|nr:hypothetical protein BJ165DRAFT_1501959 [Panaeolus papilionaceus]